MMDRIDRIHHSFIQRQAEPTDTEDAIYNHDPDYIKKKKGDKNDRPWAEFEQDAADISVESLIIFLEGLLRDNQPIEKETDTTDPKMKKAIAAYGRDLQKV